MGEKLTKVEPEGGAQYAHPFEPGMIRICPMRDGPCPHGMACPYVGDGAYGYPCKDGWRSRRALEEGSKP